MLTTIDKVKEVLGDTSEKDDIRLTSCLTRASTIIEGMTGRTFASTVYTTEIYDGTGTHYLQLRNFPVITLSQVLEAGNALTIGTSYASGTDVVVEAEIGRIHRLFALFYSWPKYYSVTYTAGFAAVPDDIVEVAIQLTLLMLKEKERAGILQHSTGAAQSTYTRKLPEWAQQTMDGYTDHSLGRHT